MRLAATLTLLLTLGVSTARAGEEEVDHLQLAAVLAGDGNYERAERSLERVDENAEDLNRERYYLVRGIVRLHRALYSQAVSDFQRSVAAGEAKKRAGQSDGPKPAVFLYLGQASFYAEDYVRTLSALARAGAVADAVESSHVLKAESLWRLGRKQEAWAAIETGRARFPNYGELARRQFFYAIDLGLYHLAATLGTAFQMNGNASAEDAIAFGRALGESGNVDEAIRLLEASRLRHPKDSRLPTELARSYAKARKLRTAAGMMERAAFAGAPDAFETAAGLHRRAGDSMSALALNRHVRDGAKRLRQRLAILVDQGRFEAVALLENDLRRLSVLDDEAVRYAVAYAHFKTGRLERAEKLLSGLRNPELFRKAAELRGAMKRCESNPWSC